MNEIWQGLRGTHPIVEFHDIRTETGATDRYLELVEGPLGDACVRNGGGMMGQFRVDLHENRLIVLRRFGDMIDRRQALGRFHASPTWSRHRAELAGLEREASVLLTRAVAPSSGTRPLRYGEGVTLMISELRFAEQVGNYHLWLRLMLRKAGLDPIAAFATLESVIVVPAVPVVKNRTHHVALLPQGGRVPPMPAALRDMLRFSPEILSLQPAAALVW
jgi:hypothetical protein